MAIKDNLNQLIKQLPKQTTLVAVSKTKPVEAILEAYNSGHKIFGENKAQEMAEKYEALPKDIKWHMIGHLQRNKVKYIAPFVDLIHSVDSYKLLQEINKRAEQNNRQIRCLLQIKIADEHSKFGLSKADAIAILNTKISALPHVRIVGFMGMASFTDNNEQIATEFKSLEEVFKKTRSEMDIENFNTLSIGMSNDYLTAIDCGSTMIRIGSRIFGERNY